MKVNGRVVTSDGSVALSDLLCSLGYNMSRIAVELNGSIVPREEYRSVTVGNNDLLEVVGFVGGG